MKLLNLTGMLSSGRPRHSSGAAQLERHAIAVLPFVNLSTDQENEYFSDGMAEEIINALTQVKGLRVAARTSCFAFKGKDLDAQTIAQRLRVNSLVEGSIRKLGNRIRLTAQLVDAVRRLPAVVQDLRANHGRCLCLTGRAGPGDRE